MSMYSDAKLVSPDFGWIRLHYTVCITPRLLNLRVKVDVARLIDLTATCTEGSIAGFRFHVMGMSVQVGSVSG